MFFCLCHYHYGVVVVMFVSDDDGNVVVDFQQLDQSVLAYLLSQGEAMAPVAAVSDLFVFNS